MENLRKANIKVTLVPTIVQGLNDHQIGDIFIEFVNTFIRERANQKSWNFTNWVFEDIIACDIDGLKLINDTLGHAMGDKLLKTAAQILQRSFRASDIIARIGGDEFAVLLPETSNAIVQECA